MNAVGFRIERKRDRVALRWRFKSLSERLRPTPSTSPSVALQVASTSPNGSIVDVENVVRIRVTGVPRISDKGARQGASRPDVQPFASRPVRLIYPGETSDGPGRQRAMRRRDA